MLYQDDFTHREKERGREATTAVMQSAVRNGTELIVHPLEPFFHRRKSFSYELSKHNESESWNSTGLQNINTLNSLST